MGILSYLQQLRYNQKEWNPLIFHSTTLWKNSLTAQEEYLKEQFDDKHYYHKSVTEYMHFWNAVYYQFNKSSRNSFEDFIDWSTRALLCCLKEESVCFDSYSSNLADVIQGLCSSEAWLKTRNLFGREDVQDVTDSNRFLRYAILAYAPLDILEEAFVKNRTWDWNMSAVGIIRSSFDISKFYKEWSSFVHHSDYAKRHLYLPTVREHHNSRHLSMRDSNLIEYCFAHFPPLYMQNYAFDFSKLGKHLMLDQQINDLTIKMVFLLMHVHTRGENTKSKGGVQNIEGISPLALGILRIFTDNNITPRTFISGYVALECIPTSVETHDFEHIYNIAMQLNHILSGSISSLEIYLDETPYV